MTFYDAGTVDENGVQRNFHYQLAKFSDETELYQEVDTNGYVTRFLDMNGNVVDSLPTTEYGIIDSNPPRPSWGL